MLFKLPIACTTYPNIARRRAKCFAMHCNTVKIFSNTFDKLKSNPSKTAKTLKEAARIHCILYLLLVLTSGGVYAQSSSQHDSEAPIAIEADSAEQNEALGLIVYKGNVLIKQSDLTITADKVSIQSHKDESGSKRQLRFITATGNPARLTHSVKSTSIDNEGPQSVRAQAEKILFEVGKSQISLTQNALLVQNQSSVSGDLIEYSIEQRRVKAKTLNPEKGGRVHTIISSDDDNFLPAIN